MRSKYLYWAPRVLAILFIAFLSIFALDVFGEGYGFLELSIALFMHLIPVFGLVAVLLIAWRWEKIGGIIFIILALGFTVFFNTYQQGLLVFLAISGPPFLIGALFWISSLEAESKAVRKIKSIKTKKAGKAKKKKRRK